MKPYTVGAIFARGGSRGLPRKNIRLLAGKPLIGYAIETALATDLIDRVIVSTDDDEIAEIAKGFGAEVPFMRPDELARSDSPEWPAWQHTIRWFGANDPNPKMDVFVVIPPTSPLRAVEDVDACIQTLLEGDAELVIVVKPAERNPYFNMFLLDQLGYARQVIPQDDVTLHHRQSAPQVFDVTTVAYATLPDFVLSANSMYEGRIKAVVVPAERGLDIDTELDLELAELLLSRSAPNR